MARIKFTALVESIRGSIAGTTFQRNAYGFTVKSKPNMVKPNRPSQLKAQLVQGSSARRWRQITNTNRDQWRSYAATFPIASRLNPDSNLNGFNYFCKRDSIASLYSLLANPGTTQTTFELDQIDVILDAPDLIVEGIVTVGTGNWAMNVYLTSTLRDGQQFIPITPRFVGTSQVVGGTASVDCTSIYLDRFGTLPAIGDRIGMRAVFFRTDNAQMEFIPIQSVIVTA